MNVHARVSRSSQPSSGMAPSTANRTSALTRKVPSAAGSAKASSIRPAQAITTADTQKNAATVAAPASTPTALPQPPTSPATGAATAVAAAVTRRPGRRNEMSQGAWLRGGRAAGAVTGAPARPRRPAAPGRRLGPHRARGGVLGAAALALRGQFRRPRLPGGPPGTRAENDDDAHHQQHGDRDEQLRLAAGDGQA